MVYILFTETYIVKFDCVNCKGKVTFTCIVQKSFFMVNFNFNFGALKNKGTSQKYSSRKCLVLFRILILIIQLLNLNINFWQFYFTQIEVEEREKLKNSI